jgi:hypothetical protein
MAIDCETGEIDTDWDGNISFAGRGRYTPSGQSTYAAHSVVCDADDNFYIYYNTLEAADGHSVVKIDSTGAVVTAWGTGGIVQAGEPDAHNQWIRLAGNYVFTLGTRVDSDGTDTSEFWIRGFRRSDGEMVFSETISSSAGNYTRIAVAAGHLIIGTLNNSPATGYLERWTFNLSRIEGFDPAGFSGAPSAIIPLGPTRDILDANPRDIIEEIITNTRWGARRPATDIDTDRFDACELYWAQKGMLLSLTIDDSKSWKDWIDYILSHCDGARFNSQGKICLGVLRDTDTVFELDDDDLVQPSPDADILPPKVQIITRPYSDTYNRIEVAWKDRNNKYDLSVAVAYDAVDQAKSGTVRKKTVKLLGITNAALAQHMAYRFLIDAYRFNLYKFIVTYENIRIENFDVGTLSDLHLLSGEKVRVLKRQEAKHGRYIEITSIADYASLYPDIDYSTEETRFTEDPAVSLADATVNFNEDNESRLLNLCIAPGGAQTNGWYIYRSYDDSSYELAGRCGIDGVTGGDANSSGTTTTALAAHTTQTWAPDETVTVSIGTVTDLPTAITEDEFWGNRRLIKIGDEIIAYKTAVETATPGTWQISNLRRGLFGTEPAAHSIGASFCTFDSSFLYSFAEADVGGTLYFKALTYYGDNVQNIADVSSFSVTIAGHYQRPAAASLLRLNSDLTDGPGTRNGDYIQYTGSSFTLYWNLGSRVSGYGYGGYGDVPYGNYTADDDLQDILLEFEETDGTPISDRQIAVASSETITKATDFGGNNQARIRVVPRRVLGSRLENSILVEDGI